MAWKETHEEAQRLRFIEEQRRDELRCARSAAIFVDVRKTGNWLNRYEQGGWEVLKD